LFLDGLQVASVVEEKRHRVTLHYYLLSTTPCTHDGVEDDIDDAGIKSFIKAGQLIPVDIFAQTHGPFCKLFGDGLFILVYVLMLLLHQKLALCGGICIAG
jgi:hypothetical protein